MVPRLEPEQIDLLSQLVESDRSIPRDKRGSFILIQSFGADTIIHAEIPGPELVAHARDVRMLARYGFIVVNSADGSVSEFDLTPEGIEFYEANKLEAGAGAASVEAELTRYLDSEDFSRRHAGALAKWRSAADALWASDSDRALTSIGHDCREAMQLFAAEIVGLYKPSGTLLNASKTVDRVRAVLAKAREKLGETEAEFLAALLAYWGTVSDLVQRQEHGALQEGEPLAWEDGRRLVFQTAIVMFELDRALVRALGTGGPDG
jgi:hypothetical protein